MRGLMMDVDLTITSLIQYAAKFHGEREIVSRRVEGDIHRYSYADAYARMGQLANALTRLGVKPGDRIATLAWNGYRHLELYYAVPGIKAICHPLNPRLATDQLTYIINHAEDSYLFFDLSFVPLVARLSPRLPRVKGFVALTDKGHLPDGTGIPRLLCYEELLTGQAATFDWPPLNEYTACSLCYTSGTTGHPKGVLYHHRSSVLHTFAVCSGDCLGLRSRDSMLPVVPMFHVNAWGIPYAAAMVGAKLVLPGPQLDSRSLFELFDQEGVTVTAGIPTVWLEVLDYLEQTGHRPKTLQRMCVGGSAVPCSMIEKFEEVYNIHLVQGWGMTEMSPMGAIYSPKRDMADWPAEQRYRFQVKSGRPPYGVEMKLVDEEGREVAHDGKTPAHLLVHGPWVASGYYQSADRSAFTPDNWFQTGDIATMDTEGFIQITDRTKDLIRSGGEWISSIDLESIAMGHPAVREAAVIAIPHPKWQERPLLIVVLKEGKTTNREELLAFFKDKVASWWIPDEVVFADELPHTATGKVYKLKLRQEFADSVSKT